MSSSPTTRRESIDFGRAFTFVTDDPDWVGKILMGGLFSLLSMLLVGWFFLSGYLVRVVRRSARGEEPVLPPWDDLGGIFTDGLPAVGIQLIHSALFFLVPVLAGCTAGAMGGGFAGLFGGGRSSEDTAAVLFATGFMIFYGLAAIAALALSLYLPAALVRFALLERFGAAFEVRENLDFIRRNLANYALSLVLYLVANFLAQFGFILCCVGLFPAMFWSYCLVCWSLGQTARFDTQPTA
jgi:hypothetical protein